MSSREAFGRCWPWIALTFVVLFAASVRYPLLDVPLDRDEGGYAYGGRVLLEGGATYRDFYTMRYPSIFGAYAVMMSVFGESVWGIHFGLLVVVAVTTVFTFLFARELFGDATGVAAAAFFAVLQLGPRTEAFSANSEQFVIAFATPAMWLLWRGEKSRTVWPMPLSGVLFGSAYLMKQHGALYGVAGGVFLLVCACRSDAAGRRSYAKAIAWVAAGAAAPVTLTVAYIAASGGWSEFWFWTFTYARGYASSTPVADGLRVLGQQLIVVAWPFALIWLFAALGVVSLGAKRPAGMMYLLLVLAASIAAVSVGLYFRSHYFRLLFPALSVLAAFRVTTFASTVREARRAATASALVLLACTLPLIAERLPLFAMSPGEVSRYVSGANPFPESIEIARYIREHTDESDTVAILGSEPQVLFYANRRAPTGHMYMYEMTEVHPNARELQEKFIAGLENAKPKYIVDCAVPTSWLLRAGSDTLLVDWAGPYLRDHYDCTGLVDLLRTGPEYHWDADAQDVEPMTPLYVKVYRRRE